MPAAQLRALRWIAVSLLALAFATSAAAQVVELEQERVQMALLNGLWRFHTGDDPAWAAPGFDDSQWPLLKADESWFDQGYKGYSGYAWYRFQIKVPEKHPPLALYLYRILSSYEVYADGKLIGSSGTMGSPSGTSERRVVFTLPTAEGQRSVTIAIRVWHWPYLASIIGGGPQSEGRVGSLEQMQQWRMLSYKEHFWNVAARGAMLLIELLTGIGALLLFAIRRTEREYLWFALSQLANAASLQINNFSNFFSYSRQLYLLGNCIDIAQLIFFVLFVFAMVKQRRRLAFWIAIVSAILVNLGSAALNLGWGSPTGIIAVLGVMLFPLFGAIVWVLYRGARRKEPDSLLMLAAIGISVLVNAVFIVVTLLYTTGTFRLGYFTWIEKLSEWPFPYSLGDLSDALSQLALLGILILRFARSRREEEHMSMELASARAVQQVLVPEEIPTVPGFAIRSVYKPAGFVGGDFFQILALPGGAVLAAIGDVSGKGMPAAMTVSLLVGTLRTLAHYTTSPSEILAGMNQRLQGRLECGFATCLVLRADASGTFTVANAGHPQPYRDGEELELTPGLPLGVKAENNYEELSFRLGEGQCLTLLTDGVLEARTKSGELFGFARTAAISKQPAESIADTAQQFGQEDDITVLTLTRVAVAEASAA